MTPTGQNLNAKLSPRPREVRKDAPREVRKDGAVAVKPGSSAIHDSAPPVRIVGAASRYQGGGYRVNC